MKIGAKVSVIDEPISGVITAIQNKKITILTEDGFEIQYTEKELVVIDDVDTLLFHTTPPVSRVLNEKKIGSTKKTNKIKLKSKSRKIPPMEVDLHIEKLINSTKGLDNYDFLNIQLEEVRKKLQFAFNKKIQRIVFIHGVGEGVLKEELKYLLKKYDNLKYYDADYQKYGLGATEVYIFQKSLNYKN